MCALYSCVSLLWMASLVVRNNECQQYPCNSDFINAKEISASVVHKDKMWFINKVIVYIIEAMEDKKKIT